MYCRIMWGSCYPIPETNIDKQIKSFRRDRGFVAKLLQSRRSFVIEWTEHFEHIVLWLIETILCSPFVSDSTRM